MRRLTGGLLSIVALALAGCNAPTFNVDLSATGVIPGITPVANGLFPSSITSNASLTQTFSNNGVKADEIKSAQITAATVSVSPSSAQYLARISELDVQVSADGMPTVTIASQGASAFVAMPASGVVTLTIPDVELKSYVAASSVTVTPHVTFGGSGAPPVTNVPLHLDMTLHVVGQIP